MNRARVDNEGRFHHMCWIEYEGEGVMSDSHAHEWNDAWGAECVICHMDLNEYADAAQARIAQLEAENAAERRDRITLEQSNASIAARWNKAQAVDAKKDAMREIVQAVATMDLAEYDGYWSCPFWSVTDFACGRKSNERYNNDTTPPPDFVHSPNCPVTKARALLAAEKEE